MVRPTSASADVSHGGEKMGRRDSTTKEANEDTFTTSHPQKLPRRKQARYRQAQLWGGDNWHQGSEPGAAERLPLETIIPVECNPAHVRYEANADRARKPRQSGTRWAQRIQSVEEELLQSMQDVEDLWREKYSAPRRKPQGIAEDESRDGAEDRPDDATRDRVRAAVQRAERQVSSPERLAHPSPPVRAEGCGGSTRRWANHPAATPESDQHPTGNGRVGWPPRQRRQQRTTRERKRSPKRCWPKPCSAWKKLKKSETA